MSAERISREEEQCWLELEMTERLSRLRAVQGNDDPITEFRRERDLNEAIDMYSDLLKTMGSTAIGLSNEG
jgi:hypothetical protein